MSSPTFYSHRSNPRITELLMMGGQAQAEHARRQAELWGGTLAGVGQAVGGAIQQHQEQKRQTKNEQALLMAMDSWDDNDPQESAKRLVRVAGPEGLKLAQGYMALRKNAENDDPKSHLMTAKASIQFWKGLSPEGKAQAYPRLLQGLAPTGQKLGIDPSQVPMEYGPEAEAFLDNFVRATDTYLGTKPPEKTKLTEVSPGASLFNPETGKVEFTAPTAPKEGKKYEVTVPGPDGKPVKKLVSEEELAGGVRTFEAERAPAYQSKEVLNDEGKAVMANFDARSGRYIDTSTGQAIKAPRPVPSATDSQDARKFKQAQPVLSAITDLSEKINTLQGVAATAKGIEAQAKAKINLDDNVAEYDSLVSGFTPMVARALGHTGVLTEQDVQSVKNLFPRPTDSKSLRDRKVKRMLNIIGSLEAGATPGATAPAIVDHDALADSLRKKYGTK